MSRKPTVRDFLTDSLIRSVKSAFTDAPPPHPADSYCSDALAFGLGVAAVVAFVAIFTRGVLS
jgi:hypothetical protein